MPRADYYKIHLDSRIRRISLVKYVYLTMFYGILRLNRGSFGVWTLLRAPYKPRFVTEDRTPPSTPGNGEIIRLY